MDTTPHIKMKIAEDALNGIIDNIASLPAESGGILLGFESDYVIRKFVPDSNAHTTGSTYTLNTEFLNPVIKKAWDEDKMSLIGIIHSHPNGYQFLSSPDRQYFSKLLSKISRKQFFTPIVFTIPNGGFRLFPYVLSSDGQKCQTALIEIAHENNIESEDETSRELIDGFIPAERPVTPNLSTYIKKVIQLEILLLKAISIAWFAWLLFKITFLSSSLLIKILEHATI